MLPQLSMLQWPLPVSHEGNDIFHDSVTCRGSDMYANATQSNDALNVPFSGSRSKRQRPNAIVRGAGANRPQHILDFNPLVWSDST